VLDLSTMIAAPLAASMLSDWGAEVVKIERPGYGDHVRRFGAQRSGEGLYWKTLARNKRCVALDLHRPEAQALLRRWIPTFDVVIENFRPGTLEKWDLAPEDLRAAAPGLVVLRITAFGQSGPYRDLPGFGTLAEAMSGLASVTGFEDRPPLLPAVPMADIIAGILGAGAVSAALVRRGRDGSGETIDLAIYEAMLKLVELQLIEYDQNHTLHHLIGNRIEDTAPRGAYECADGDWIALSASTQPIAERVLQTIGGEAMRRDPRFATNEERVAHSEELDAAIAAWCKRHDRAAALAIFSANDCAAGPLESVATMLANPQIVARGSIVAVDDPALGPIRMTNVYPTFAETPQRAFVPGPRAIGADTRAVLAGDLGLDDAELERLRALGAIAWPEATAKP
jgi:crotonobetainyl-CoA:carnitine CoA-transferase CaiB-like acyl-CoA transferase